MLRLSTTNDTAKAYEDFGVDRAAGLGADVLAAFIKRGHSLAEEMRLGGEDYSKRAMPPSVPKFVSPRAATDASWEAQGWYRTARAAALCGCNPLWLAYAVECGMMPRRSGKVDLMTERHRVRLEDVRKWMGEKG
jgi:hypothetical protein